MKKFLALLLVLLMSVTMFSCTKKIEYNDAKDLSHKYLDALATCFSKQLGLRIKNK